MIVPATSRRHGIMWMIIGFVCGCLYANVTDIQYMSGYIAKEICESRYASPTPPPTIPPVSPPPTPIPTEPPVKALISPNSPVYGLMKPLRVSEAFAPDDPGVCILIRTYAAHRNSLGALIASLASNNYPNLHLFLIDTNDNFNNLSEYANLYNTLYAKEFVHLSNITYVDARARYPLFQQPTDYGYLQTDLMLEQLSSPNSSYSCDYFIATNGDNQYSRDLLRLTVGEMRKKMDLIGFHFITHYCYDDSQPWRPRPGCYSQHYTELLLQRIDIGAALLRKERIIKSHLFFLISELEKDPTGEKVQLPFCDGFFFQSFASATPDTIILNATLFVHQ